ncbi:hypothetical protein FOA52_012442 [Chlamydomonas sp. UWO 241]|nr:hypothetical protein FOA52_012442 [Chlamydomonas sp. UWO 241]
MQGSPGFYEYDAPKFYDFNRDDDGASQASEWFDDEEERMGLSSPLGELTSNDVVSKLAVAGAHRPAAPASAPPAKTNNLVTSWGGAAAAVAKAAIGTFFAKPVGASSAAAAAGAAAKPRAAAAAAAAGGGAAHAGGLQQQPQQRAGAVRTIAAARDSVGGRQPALPAIPSGAPASRQPAPGGVKKPSKKSGAAPRRRSLRLIRKAEASSADGHAGGRAAGKPGNPALKMAAAVHKRALATQRSIGAPPAALGGGGATRAPSSRLKIMHVCKVVPIRSTKPLTMPDDIELRTSKRAKTTEPAPGTPFKSVAAKVIEFHKKTPARFRCRPGPPPQHAPGTCAAMTSPHSPSLMTAARSRPAHVKSRAQMEEEQMASMPRFVASALDRSVLDGSQRLAASALRAPQQPTAPAPFVFVTDDRAERRRAARGGDDGTGDGFEPSSSFKATALNHSILEGPGFVPMRQRRTSTVPRSPMLHTKRRASSALPRCTLGLDRARPDFIAPAAPAYLPIPFECMLRSGSYSGFLAGTSGAHAPGEGSYAGTSGAHASGGGGIPEMTRVEPFALATEARGRHHASATQARMAEEAARPAVTISSRVPAGSSRQQAQGPPERDRAMRQPRAQPLPLSTDVPMVPPRPEPRGLTLPQPFKLRSEARHAAALEAAADAAAMSEQQQQAAATFHALPLPPFERVFVPRESDAPLTVPAPLDLATQRRAPTRAQFDAAVAEKARLEEEAKQEEEEQQRLAEENEVREMRKNLKPKARPVPDFSRPFMAMPSGKRLTNPITPKFGKTGGGGKDGGAGGGGKRARE